MKDNYHTIKMSQQLSKLVTVLLNIMPERQVDCYSLKKTIFFNKSRFMPKLTLAILIIYWEPNCITFSNL